MRRADFASYVFLALAWGLSFLVLLKVVHAFGWMGAVTLRCLVAGMTLVILAILTRRRLDFSAGWMRFTIVGATTVAGQLIGLSWSTPIIGTAMAAILVAAIPLFSMLIGQIWGHERIRPEGLLGLVIGTLGIVLLVGFPAVPMTGQFLLGCAACLAGCFCAAFGSNFVARTMRNVGPWEVTAGAFLTGGAMTLPLLVFVPVPAMPGAMDLLYLLILGGVMSATTYVLYFQLVGSIGPTRTISVEFVVTVVAVLVGAVALGEPLSWVQLAGGVTVIAGCSLVVGLWSGRRPAAPHAMPPAAG